MWILDNSEKKDEWYFWSKANHNSLYFGLEDYYYYFKKSETDDNNNQETIENTDKKTQLKNELILLSIECIEKYLNKTLELFETKEEKLNFLREVQKLLNKNNMNLDSFNNQKKLK